jgi:hypothetical protein
MPIVAAIDDKGTPRTSCEGGVARSGNIDLRAQAEVPSARRSDARMALA